MVSHQGASIVILFLHSIVVIDSCRNPQRVTILSRSIHFHRVLCLLLGGLLAFAIWRVELSLVVLKLDTLRRARPVRVRTRVSRCKLRHAVLEENDGGSLDLTLFD